jgi:hypothetical protein
VVEDRLSIGIGRGLKADHDDVLRVLEGAQIGVRQFEPEASSTLSSSLLRSQPGGCGMRICDSVSPAVGISNIGSSGGAVNTAVMVAT